MALNQAGDREEITPLISTLTDYDNIEINQVKDPDDGKVPMFLLFGPKLKIKRIISIYYLMGVFILFRVSFNNGWVLLLQNLKIIFSDRKLNKSFDEKYPLSEYGLSPLSYAVPGLISLIFAILSDYNKYQRSYLLIYSFGLASFSEFLVTVCSYIMVDDLSSMKVLPENLGPLNITMLQIISVLAVVSYVLGYAMFIPMPLTFGLDLLQGTKWEVLYLYFPFVYFCNSIGDSFSYLLYLDFPCRINCIATLAMSVTAWILFIIGRSFDLFPYFTPRVELEFTIRKGVRIFCFALKKRWKIKSPRGHWFIQLASDMFYGEYPHHQVQMVSAFFKVNFTLMILLGILATYQEFENLFPKQSKFLSWPTQVAPRSNGSRNCSSYAYLSSFIFINSFGVITIIPLFEFIFCNLIFFTDPKATPKWFRYIRSAKIKSTYKTLRDSIRNYFHLVDTIPKKIFWGLFLGLTSIICGLMVDVARILASPNNNDNLTCNNNEYGICADHTVSVFSQIPQYYFSGGLEVLAIVGCQQFVYFQCFTSFQDTYKGFFLGLYYFYSCVGIIISNMTFLALDKISTDTLCLIYTESCIYSDQYTWVVWLMLVITYLIIIVLFGAYSHYNHYQIIFNNEKIIDDLVQIDREDG